MNFPGGWELVLVLLVIMVLFGAKRLPDSARALGRSLRILKSEAKAMDDDDKKRMDAQPKELPGPEPKFDPYTGEPVKRFDPVTGEPITPPSNDR